MAFQTVNGFDPAGGTNPVGSTGVKEWSGGAVASSDLTKDFKDTYQPASWGMCVGVLAGGVCTTASFFVTVPSGTYYYASQVWYASTSTTVLVADNTTYFIWGRSDGVLDKTTAANILPAGYSRSQCCLLCKVTYASSVGTIDLTVQDAARIADNTNRFVTENNAQIGYGFVSEMDTVPAAAVINIPVGYQQTLFGPMTVSGTLTINGRLKVTD